MSIKDLFLNGALLKRGGEADFSSFTNLKITTPLAGANSQTVASVGYVTNALNSLSGSGGDVGVLKATVGDSNSGLVQQVNAISTRVNTFLDVVSTDNGTIDTLKEIIASVNSLDSAQGADILTKFNAVTSQLTDVYAFFGQTKESVEAAIAVTWPTVYRTTMDGNFFTLLAPSGAGIQGGSAITYALQGTSALVKSISSSGLVELMGGETGSFTVTATNGIRTVQANVVVVEGWMIEAKLFGNANFNLTPPASLANASFPSEYQYIASNVANNAFTVSTTGSVTINAEGNGTIQIKKLSDNSIPFSSILMINPWTIPSKNLYDDDFQVSITGVTGAIPSVFKYIASNVTGNAFSVSETGYVTINNAAGTGTIKLVTTAGGAVQYSAVFTVTNNWPAVSPKSLIASSFILTPPTSMNPVNGAITYSVMEYDNPGVFSLSQNNGIYTITPHATGSRMITAMQGTGMNMLYETVNLIIVA
jgi:hypothetical protein